MAQGQATLDAGFVLGEREGMLAYAARVYMYAQHAVPKGFFEDPTVKELMDFVAKSKKGTAHVLTAECLDRYVDAEFENLLKFIKFVTEEK